MSSMCMAVTTVVSHVNTRDLGSVREIHICSRSPRNDTFYQPQNASSSLNVISVIKYDIQQSSS